MFTILQTILTYICEQTNGEPETRASGAILLMGKGRLYYSSEQGAGMYWVSILQNLTGMFYIGHMDDLDQRLISHNRSDQVRGKFTRKNGPWTLVWCERWSTRSSAMARERQIKAKKSSRWIRENLLKGRVPICRVTT